MSIEWFTIMKPAEGWNVVWPDEITRVLPDIPPYIELLKKKKPDA